ncbi:MAG: hypothetical protein ACON5H_08215 [Akkermansiaceae bacterium]
MPRRQINLQAGKSNRMRRAARPSLGDTLKLAKQRTRDMQNIRAGRRAGMSAMAAIAESGNEFVCDHDFHIPWPSRMMRWAVALLVLAPLCFITILTLFQRVGDAHFLAHFYKTTEFVCFSAGVVLMISWFFSGLLGDKFLYLYVLGHELTHAFFVYFCFGRISDMRVSTQGGYIMTNKSNLLIALSPYFVPFWSVVVLAIFGLISIATEIPFGEQILLVLLGGSWCFHIVWTIWMIPKDQPDLKEHGTFFSLMIIFFCNLVLLALMVCAASPAITYKGFAFNWANIAWDLGEAGILQAKGLLREFIG